jgi:hypothetical protein
VLVESKSGDLLWDASVIEVSTGSGDDLVRVIDAYKVSYNGWSARFEDWVKPSRVIEPNENNRLLQDELLEQYSETRGGLPPALNMLRAKDYLNIRDRARGNLPLPDFARIAYLNEGMSSSEKTFNKSRVANSYDGIRQANLYTHTSGFAMRGSPFREHTLPLHRTCC